LRTLIALILLGALVACTKPAAPQPPTTEETKPEGLAAIPPADRTQYPNFHNLKDWKNPYLVIREDGIGFVDSANSEVRILKPEDVIPVLTALPDTAWPYGLVVMIGQVDPPNPTEEAKAQLRKNRGLLMGTLKESKVQVYEAP
jgi:hypothetical protein